MYSSLPITPTRSIHDMPVLGSKDAPKKFRGRYTEVQNFVDHYERLLKRCQVTSDRQKCEHILKYCTIDVQYVIQTLDGFDPPRWSQLKREILKHFDADRMYQKYKPADVERFAAQHSQKSCHNLTAWRRYFVKYSTIAGGPLKKGYLSREDYNAYFFVGIQRPLRQILENRILQTNPFRDDTAQYTVAEINAAADWYFRRNKYETLMVRAADWGEEFDEDSEDESASDTSESELSDSDYEKYRLKKKQKAKKKKAEKKKKSPVSKKKTPGKETQKFQGTEEEVATLIRKLGSMKLDDPEYAPVYYKVMVLDQTGLAGKCVKPPEIHHNSSYRPEPPRFLNRPPPTRDSPATYPNNIPLSGTAPSPPRELTCFGCAGLGHRISDCPSISDLLQRKIV
ncbi:hypothetical protein C8R45DRAFT_831870, partial [Mycena sanguinolenta]